MSRVSRLAVCLVADRSAASTPYVEKKVDPALLTYQEFSELVNPGGKGHPSSAYDWSMDQMDGQRERYPTLLFRRNVHGIAFEFRLEKKDRHQYKYVKSDANGNQVRINGELQYYTPEELVKIVPNRYEHSFSVFDGDQQVAVAQDEWGCVLVSVAREYRNFGLGPILTKMAWEAEPGKSTGGCTPGGAAVVKKVHREFVREYLRKGFYSHLVREGTLTKERAQAILASASLSAPASKNPYQDINLGSNDPKDFLLYVDEGHFVLYDRKLKDLIDKGDDDRNSFWYDRFIKGTSFAGGGYHPGNNLYLHQLGGDTQQIKKLMFNLAVSYCKMEGVPLHVYDEDLAMANQPGVDVDGNLVSLKGTPVDYRGMAVQEQRFRNSFDRYQEFKSRLLELAESKYR